jgi:uncharacterized protein
MWSHRYLLLTLLSIGFGFGCQKPTAPPPATNLTSSGPTQAQPKLPTLKLYLGTQEIVAEIARTAVQLQTGMMFRKEMGENEGMLFVFPRPHQASFYMRNTLLPLAGAYIDSEGTILEIHAMKPLDETSITAGTDQVRFVLEMRDGWFDRHSISTGTVIRAQQGSLSQVFFGN